MSSSNIIQLLPRPERPHRPPRPGVWPKGGQASFSHGASLMLIDPVIACIAKMALRHPDAEIRAG